MSGLNIKRRLSLAVVALCSALGASAVSASAVSANADDRDCFFCNVQIVSPEIVGPTTIPAGVTGTWTGIAQWSFDYDLRPGEVVKLTAQALTFLEFTPPDDLWDADIAPSDTIICEPDCVGHASFFVSFKAIGAFDPPAGKTTQTIYLIPEATLTSPDGSINIYAMPIAVPRITVTVTVPATVPEPPTSWLMLAGLSMLGLRNVRRASSLRRGG